MHGLIIILDISKMRFKLYNYLYWCFYNLVWKKKGDSPQESATVIFSVIMLIIFFTACVWASIFFEIREIWTKNVNYVLVLPALALINIIVHLHYYVKNGYYKKVVKYFDKVHSKKTSRIVALGVIIFAFGFFMVIGVNLSKFLHR